MSMDRKTFFKVIRGFSGLPRNKAQAQRILKKSPFWIDRMRLQDDLVLVELVSVDGFECEFGIGLDDLVDGFVDYLSWTDPESAEKDKATTLAALERAVERLKDSGISAGFESLANVSKQR